TGEVIEDPAEEPIKVYPVTLEGNEIRVGVG
ncbi:MAG: ferredoxin, partial [Chloroflexi bacterium]|nr:ferredoxin [Chloroflexota bacterium]